MFRRHRAKEQKLTRLHDEEFHGIDLYSSINTCVIGLKISEEDKVGRVCSIQERKGKCLYLYFFRHLEGKRPTDSWDYNIKTDLKAAG